MGSPRHKALFLLLMAALAFAVTMPLSQAFAKDGDGGGGGSGGGSNSGHGGGDDGDGGDDHGGHGHDDGKAGGANAMGGSGSSGMDYDRARDAVRDGQIMSLRAMLKSIDISRYGRVIDVRLSRSAARDLYQLKLRDNKGVIRTLFVDARNGTLLGSE
ncbi:PepSY domain-containing protein [Neorhizobium alkalisoli]|uniref:PepSY domain-containing protein n=1 Tax=Neorhizobium alkalisoli TaxID=528178 RepID=A0A561QPM8_9HYPH|nr:hypothetical protein [Neorhizobium alkalisoli]TWF52317.1 hypothetical protein FHW37_105420 [Neorhizobium alkalisoli]